MMKPAKNLSNVNPLFGNNLMEVVYISIFLLVVAFATTNFVQPLAAKYLSESSEEFEKWLPFVSTKDILLPDVHNLMWLMATNNGLNKGCIQIN